MEITIKYHKTNTLKNWKRNGVINENLEEIYQTYINTTECNHCGKVFENTKDRCMDHCHETGLFRKIVCQSCNKNDMYIRFPAGIPSKQERNKIRYKKFRDNNKEKIKEYQKEYNEKNKEIIKDKMKQYQLKNKEKIKEQRRKKYQEKKQLGLI